MKVLEIIALFFISVFMYHGVTAVMENCFEAVLKILVDIEERLKK